MAALVMVASTNLVLELGLVLWILLGWQFALSEYVGEPVGKKVVPLDKR